jgi:hypothetical protein
VFPILHFTELLFIFVFLVFLKLRYQARFKWGHSGLKGYGVSLLPLKNHCDVFSILKTIVAVLKFT